MNRFVLAGTGSGVGKTTFTIGIMRALMKRLVSVNDRLTALEDQQFQRDAAEWNAEKQKEAKTGVNADGRQKDK